MQINYKTDAMYNNCLPFCLIKCYFLEIIIMDKGSITLKPTSLGISRLQDTHAYRINSYNRTLLSIMCLVCAVSVSSNNCNYIQT